MYPIKFEPLYYEKIWGGRQLTRYRQDVPNGSIGERWDVACHAHGMSVVANGAYRGERLDALIARFGPALLGTAMRGERFPLLVKLIDAQDRLSVQVHPNDEYARRHEADSGKSEAWYVLAAEPGANLVIGMRSGCGPAAFRQALAADQVEACLQVVPVTVGDMFVIPSGLVHAISPGVVLVEIQQNSDLTYRVYDYNRGRELHIAKALDVIDFSLQAIRPVLAPQAGPGYVWQTLSTLPEFSLEWYEVAQSCRQCSNPNHFHLLTCVAGTASIAATGADMVELAEGESALIPASLGEYAIHGPCKLLKSYVQHTEAQQTKE